MAELEILHRGATVRIGAHENIVIVVWSEAPTLEQMLAMRHAGRGRRDKYPHGAALFDVVLRGTPRFTDDVRNEVQKQMAEDLFNLGAAHVMLVGGLVGSAVRAFIGTMILLSRTKAPQKVFAEERAAASWIAPLASKGETPVHADGIVAAFRALTA